MKEITKIKNGVFDYWWGYIVSETHVFHYYFNDQAFNLRVGLTDSNIIIKTYEEYYS